MTRNPSVNIGNLFVEKLGLAGFFIGIVLGNPECEPLCRKVSANMAP